MTPSSPPVAARWPSRVKVTALAAWRGGPLAAGGNSQGMNRPVMPATLAQFLAGGRVPQAHRLVATRRGHDPTVGRERHRLDGVSVAAEHAPLAAAGHVPEANR